MAWNTAQWGSTPRPVGNLGDLVGRMWLYLHCPACGRCAGPLDPLDLAEAHGANLALERLLERCRCRSCGHQHATIRVHPPVLPDGSDRPRASAALGHRQPPMDEGGKGA